MGELAIGPGLASGAALSNSTRERPRSSLPVATRCIGLNGVDMLFGIEWKLKSKV